MSIEITGKQPLFTNIKDYYRWVEAHTQEIIDKRLHGDEYAEMIMGAVIKLHEEGRNPTVAAGLMVAVERYIDRFHPDYAHIPAHLKTWEGDSTL